MRLKLENNTCSSPWFWFPKPSRRPKLVLDDSWSSLSTVLSWIAKGTINFLHSSNCKGNCPRHNTGDILHTNAQWFMWYASSTYSSTGDRWFGQSGECLHIIKSQVGSGTNTSRFGPYTMQASVKYDPLFGESTILRGCYWEILMPIELADSCINHPIEYSLGEHWSRRPWKKKLKAFWSRINWIRNTPLCK